MPNDNGCSTLTVPLFSVIIAVYNDWLSLDHCLRSLAQQEHAPEFEVIVVDDGSDDTAPDGIREWSRCCALRIVRQGHAGISSARNHGVRVSRGSVLIFTDTDCKLQNQCLELLGQAVTRSPRHDCFQLRLVGDSFNLVGRAEALRLSALQSHLLQSDGRIRYLNTAGFAIRREKESVEKGLFDPSARRAEDTLLLAHLMRARELPLFVGDAIIQHAVPLSFVACLVKDLRSAWLEAGTFSTIRSMGVRIRMSQGERLSILCSTWKASRGRRSAWFVLISRRMLRNGISFALQLWHAGKILKGSTRCKTIGSLSDVASSRDVYTSTWISVGPSLLKPSRSAATKSSMEAVRLAGTPIALASRSQSRSGRPI
jgi:glycosyltransferase involved in cell wall biosynthesis